MQGFQILESHGHFYCASRGLGDVEIYLHTVYLSRSCEYEFLMMGHSKSLEFYQVKQEIVPQFENAVNAFFFKMSTYCI